MFVWPNRTKPFMKQVLGVILFYTLLFSSCSVISFYPFFTSEKVVKESTIIGKWQSRISNNSLLLHWYFSEIENSDTYNLVVEKDSTQTANYEVTFFKIDDSLFANFHEKKSASQLLQFCQSPDLHSVAKVLSHPNQYEFIGLSPKWLKNQLRQKPHLLKHIQYKNRLLITANSRQLVRFLKRIVHNTNAFPNRHKITITRQ